MSPSSSSIDRISLLRRRHTARRYQRGAAMVEAAFMFPMFVILWFSAVYAHAFSATQIDVATSSRQLAWNDAMGNCSVAGSGEKETLPPKVESLSSAQRNWQSTSKATSTDIATTLSNQKLNGSGGTDTGSALSQAISGGSLEGAFGALLGPVLNAVASMLPNPQGAQSISKGSISWRMPNNYADQDPNNTTPIQTSATVPCNLAPINGGLAGLYNEIKGAVGGP